MHLSHNKISKNVYITTHQKRHLKSLLLVHDHFTVLKKKYGANPALLYSTFKA
jgi:hypothetical protein